MSHFVLTLLLATAAILIAGFAPALSQDGADKKKADEAKPHQAGKNHKLLSRFVGTWTLDAILYLPGGRKLELKGASTIKAIYGDRFVQEEFVLGEGPMAAKGQGFIGYDTSNGVFQANYLSERLTYMHVFEGSFDEKAKAFTFEASWFDKQLGLAVREKMISRELDADSFRNEFYGQYGDAPEARTVEITYRRKK